MLFAAMLKARPDIAEIRARLRDAHDAYWNPQIGRIWLAGPLLSEDGARIGQIMVVQADSREEAHALIAGDPYFVNGCFDPFDVTAFRPSVREGSAT
ncbi:MAG: YciI family protein [Rhizobiaceae bacterium]